MTKGTAFHRLAIVLFFLLVGSLTHAQGFDEGYEAYVNQSTGDIYVRKNPEIIILHGDVATPIVIPAPVDDFILDWDGNSYSVDTNTSGVNLASWQPSDARLILGDFDLNGIVDLWVKTGTTQFPAGALDQIIFAGASGALSSITEVGQEFERFFSDVAAWWDDLNYFASNLVPTTMPTYTYEVIVDVEYCFANYGWVSVCVTGYEGLDKTVYAIDTDNYDVIKALPYLSNAAFFYQQAQQMIEGYAEQNILPINIDLPAHDSDQLTVLCWYYCDMNVGEYQISVYDVAYPSIMENYPVFDRENYSVSAYEFSHIYGEIEADGEIVAQTTEAIIIDGLLKAVLGREVMGGVLVDGGIVEGVEDGIAGSDLPGDRKQAIDWNIGFVWHGMESEATVAQYCDATLANERVGAGATPDVNKTTHWGRNSNQYQQLAELNFNTLSGAIASHNFSRTGKTGTHNMTVPAGGNFPGNVDYRGRRLVRGAGGGQSNLIPNVYEGVQLIFSPNGALETDPLNAGSYDFQRAGSDEHLREDVTPWLEWGNNQADNSDQEIRTEGLYSGWSGVKLIAAQYMWDFYLCSDYDARQYGIPAPFPLYIF